MFTGATMGCSIKNIFGALLFMLFTLSIKSESTPSTYNFIPTHYDLEIFTDETHFKNATKELKFTGKVTIHMKSTGNVPNEFNFTLNSNPDMEIKGFELKDKSLSVIEGAKCSKSDDKKKVVCTATKATHEIESVRLLLEYSTPFGKDMTGFYRSSYNEDGKTKWLLTTHFEPIFARKAFPCFDEPHLKATFQVHITVPEEIKTVLSNTPVEKGPENVPGGKLVKYTFKRTNIPMSTYLVAFTASNFIGTAAVKFESDYQQKKDDKGKKELRTFGRKDIIEKKKEAELAQTIGKKAIEELTKYLGLGYAFDKVDQVGIPDFSAGAMENFGHISFREKSLFFNDTTGTAATKQANILTITHELVHQWFGNLVTLESWNYIWLNEAFANYIEYIIANKFDETQKWDLLKQMVVNEIHLRAFETDGLNSSKPLNNNITDENLIYSSFNDIPYSKGAAVLRMWHVQMKDDVFQKSLKSYLNERQQSTANPDQLQEQLEGISKENFKSWTTQAGYPVVEVRKVKEIYTLSQSRFFWENITDKASWVIPITYTTDKGANGTITWLDKASKNFSAPGKWIIINNDQTGYYRVNYDKENWEALSDALKASDHSKISELNRAQIINDVFSLARSLQKEYVAYKTALKLAKYLEKEKSYVPWKTALNAFEFLRGKVFHEDVHKKFKDYVISLIKPHFKTLNSTSMDHIGKLKNVEISRWACSLDLQNCVNEAKDIFNKSAYNTLPDTQEIILCTVVRNNETAWDSVWKKYQEESDSALKLMYISALGCSGNQTKIKEFMKKSLDDAKVRDQDRIYVLSSVYNGHLNNIEVCFEFIKENFENIAKKYGGINPLGKALVGIARRLNTEDQVKKLRELVDAIKKKPELSAAKDSMENALNIAEGNVKWVKSRMEGLKKAINSGSFLSYSIALLSLSLLTVFQF